MTAPAPAGHRSGASCSERESHGRALCPAGQRPEEIDEARRLNETLVARAISMDGTCTGEHGVGLGKMDFLIAEHGEGVSVMRALKRALDPDNILNPGKIVRV
jgi:D-lactate dehydrogenase (cytochrome)